MTAITPSAATAFPAENKPKFIYNTRLFNLFDEKIVVILYIYIKISLQ
jgi:hypothetical protein